MTEINLFIEQIEPIDFYGLENENLKFLQEYYSNLKITARGNAIKVLGNESDVTEFKEKFESIIVALKQTGNINHDDFRLIFNEHHVIQYNDSPDQVLVHTPSGAAIKARTVNQKKVVEAVFSKDIVFAVGPAGTGKTYTAVALAVNFLREKKVKKIILTRPAVEAGESLGFLPGDLKEKIDPYLKPLYDALGDMIPGAKLEKMMETGVIEIASLAFMRGRTLDNAFVILDEAQNTTEMQLKMFLTRLGTNAKFIITGDLTQIDLPPKQRSGLKHAISILNNIDDIAFIYLQEEDVLRHKLVKKIIRAYSEHHSTTESHP